MSRSHAPLLERILRQISPEPNTGCWLWLGSMAGSGYGQIGLGSRKQGVAVTHRVLYELMVGPIPQGLDLDHLCRVRLCVNPQHLEPVTRKENLRRGIGHLPGTQASAALARSKIHCKNGHERNDTNTRILYNGKRQCIPCNRAWQRQHPNRGKPQQISAV